MYEVKGSDTYDPIGVAELDTTTPDYTQITPLAWDYSTFESGYNRVWAGQGGYLEGQNTSTSRVDVRYDRLTGSTITGAGGNYEIIENAQLFLFSFIYANNLRVMWANASSLSGLYTLIQSWNGLFPTTNTLYLNSVENAISSGILTEVKNWDESPSTDPTDPDNLEARGGEYADTMPFGALDGIGLTELELPKAQDYGRLLTAYVLDAVDMVNLGNCLFLAGTWQNLKNKFEGLADPMQFIFSCKELALDSSYIPVSNRYFGLGGNHVTNEQGVTLQIPSTLSRFTKTSLGSFDLKEVFGTSKDYTDVDISIYLPYCGVKQLDPDLVVGNRITLVVMVDIWTGDVFYTIHTDNRDIGGKYYRQEAVIYRFTGNCATNLPIGKVDNSDAVLKIASNIVGLGAGIGLAVGSGGATMVEGASEIATRQALATNVAVNNAQGLTGALSSGFNPTVQTSDGVTGAFGLMDLQYPYLIIKRGVPQYPTNFRKQIGAPRYQTLQVTNLTGFTKFSAIHLEYMGVAVSEEITELERLLTSEGIIL